MNVAPGELGAVAGGGVDCRGVGGFRELVSFLPLRCPPHPPFPGGVAEVHELLKEVLLD